MTYAEKLKDPRWQKKRLEILDRDDFTCTLCGSKKDTLHVHHHFYKYNSDPWDYPNDALETHCQYCHRIVEFTKDIVGKKSIVCRIFKKQSTSGYWLFVFAAINGLGNTLLIIQETEDGLRFLLDLPTSPAAFALSFLKPCNPEPKNGNIS